jgi:hypothetical protein
MGCPCANGLSLKDLSPEGSLPAAPPRLVLTIRVSTIAPYSRSSQNSPRYSDERRSTPRMAKRTSHKLASQHAGNDFRPQLTIKDGRNRTF